MISQLELEQPVPQLVKLTRTEQENEITPSSRLSFFSADFHSVTTYRYLAGMIEYLKKSIILYSQYCESFRTLISNCQNSGRFFHHENWIEQVRTESNL